MIRATAHSRRLLRSGASLAAIAAAWGLPQSAEAQTCTTGAVLDGVPTGTLVTCPFGTQLDFPGAVVVGQASIPNGSVITSTLNGTSPIHRQFGFTDPNGNAQFIFFQGFYDLQGGVGGATELQGNNILTFAGAGACGAGGQVCPGTPIGAASNAVNLTGFGGGGVQGGFILPEFQVQPGTGSVPNYSSIILADGQFVDTGPQTNAIPVYDADGKFAGVYVQELTMRELIEEEGLTPEEAQSRIDENSRLGELRLEGHGPTPFIAETVCGYDCRAGFGSGDLTVQLQDALDSVPSDVADAYDACNASAATCTFVLVPDAAGSGSFRYGPVFDTSGTATGGPYLGSASNVTISGLGFSDYLYTDPEGTTVFFSGTATPDPGSIAGLLQAHGQNAATLAQQNTTGAGGEGAQGTFSVPSADGSFLFTGNGQSYVVGPVVNADSSITGELRFVYNTTGIHPFDEYRPEGGATAYAISLILNQQDAGTLKAPLVQQVAGLPTGRLGEIIGMGPITGVRGGQFTLQRPSAFIVLPPDAPPPNATNINGFFPGEPKDVVKGAVLYDRRTGQRIGVIVDDLAHVVIDDNPGARQASMLPYEVFDDGS